MFWCRAVFLIIAVLEFTAAFHLSRLYSQGSKARVGEERLSMALKSDDLTRTKSIQECPLRPFRSKEQNDGLSTATFALG